MLLLNKGVKSEASTMLDDILMNTQMTGRVKSAGARLAVARPFPERRGMEARSHATNWLAFIGAQVLTRAGSRSSRML